MNLLMVAPLVVIMPRELVVCVNWSVFRCECNKIILSGRNLDKFYFQDNTVCKKCMFS